MQNTSCNLLLFIGPVYTMALRGSNNGTPSKKQSKGQNPCLASLRATSLAKEVYPADCRVTEVPVFFSFVQASVSCLKK